MSDPVIPKSPVLYGLYRFFPPSVYGPAPQNPAPFDLHGQVDLDRVKSLADQIVTVFLNSLPSNYVSQVKGPYYVQQFQAAAEELAKIQVLLSDAYEDSDYDFTRTEVLYQFLATLVFPDSGKSGLPQIDGDLTYRDFVSTPWTKDSKTGDVIPSPSYNGSGFINGFGTRLAFDF